MQMVFSFVSLNPFILFIDKAGLRCAQRIDEPYLDVLFRTLRSGQIPLYDAEA